LATLDETKVPQMLTGSIPLILNINHMGNIEIQIEVT